MSSKLVVLSVCLALLGAACSDLPHESPFDANTPLEKQAKGTVSGRVLLAGETDHAQIAVELQNATRTYAAATRNDGSFELTGVVPGAYALRYSAKSFEPYSAEIAVSLGQDLALGERTLGLKRAAVRGAAWLETIVGGTAELRGGVLVTLAQTATVRGAAGAPFRAAAAATAEARTYSAVSGADGAYEIPGVPAGTYHASAASPGVDDEDLGEVEVSGEETAVTIADAVLRPLTGFFDVDAVEGLNPAYTSSASVTLRLSGFNATRMALGVTTGADCTVGAPMTYQALHDVTLAGEGLNTVCVQYVGENGAVTDVLTRSVTLDLTPPAAALVALDGGAAASTDALGRVTLSVAAADAASGLRAMKIANAAAGGCGAPLSGAAAEPFVSVKAWALAAPTAEDRRWVCVALADAVGNWSAPVSTAILWDPVAPTGGLVLAGGTNLTNTLRTSVTLAAVGAAEMQLTDNGSFAGRSWEPYRTSAEWIFSGTGGTYTLTARFRDAAGNVSPTAADSLTIDVTPPSLPGLTINAGAAVTNATAVTLGLTALGAAEMQISTDGWFDTEPREAYAATRAFTLAAGDGYKTLYVRFLDAAGNASDTAVAQILLDRTAPGSASIVIDGGAATNNSAAGALGLALNAVDATSGLTRMKVAELGGADCAAALAPVAPEPFASTRAWALSGAGTGREQTRTLCAVFGDSAGNWSAPVSDTVHYDTAAPGVGSQPIRIDGGAAYALQTQVTLAFDATAATEMQIANEGAFGAASWEPYRGTTLWVLSAVDGSRSVQVKFRDEAGNVSGPFGAVITLDSQPPTNPALSINGGAAYATAAAVSLTLSASGATLMQISSDGTFDTEPVAALTSPYTFSLPGTDGTKFVYARFGDAAGNWSDTAGAYVVLDRIAPVAGTPLINGGAAYTQSSNVTLTLPVAGAAKAYVSNSGCLAGAAWADYVPSTAHNLGATEGPRTVYVNYRDEAGNTSACKQASITLDTAFVSPGFAATVTGSEGVAGRTKSLIVWVNVSGAGPDVAEIALANDASFGGAAWQSVASKKTWVLGAGDGLKTVYVRGRDAAGNVSAVLTPSITLDQTGPEAPALAVGDVDGDTFAVSQSSVELRWTQPSDPQRAGYELERYVPGYSSRFARIASPGAAAQTYTDAITESTGLIHYYRVRAYDDLHNYSSWSGTTMAYPFAPLQQAAWLFNTEGLQYLFAPNRGTFSLRASRSYEDLSGALNEENLGVDIVAWENPQNAGEYGEKLYVKTANQDNTLAYESEIPTRQPQRYVLRDAYAYTRMLMDSRGNPHPMSCIYPELGYGSPSGSGWSWVTPSTSGCWDFDATLDQGDFVHAVYATQWSPYTIYYMTNRGGAWINEPVTTATGLDATPAVAFDDVTAELHAVYAIDGTLTYAHRSAAGVWNYEAMFAGRAPSLALDASRSPVLLYADGAAVQLATRTGPGTWSTVTLDGSTATATDLTTNAAGRLFAAWSDWGSNSVKYAMGPAFAVSTVASGVQSNSVSLDVDGQSRPYVSYFDTPTGKVYLATNDGSWQVTHFATTNGVYTADTVGVGVDAQGNVHAAYTNWATGKLFYYGRRVGNGNEFIDSNLFAQALTTGADGRAHAFYTHPSPRKIMYAERIGSTWINEEVDGYFAHGIDFGLRSDGTVHGVYCAFDGTSGYTTRYAIRSAAGTWSTQTLGDGYDCDIAVDETQTLVVYSYWGDIQYAVGDDSGPLVSAPIGGYGVDPSVAFDSSGTAHLVYSGTGLLYRTYRAGVWSAPEVVDGAGGQPNLVVAGGIVHVVYNDNGAIKYAARRNGAWSVTVIDRDAGTAEGKPAILASSDGWAAISYSKTALARFNFATNASGGWSISRLGPGERYTAMVMGADGKPYASYTGSAADSYYSGHFLSDFFGVMPSSSVKRVSAW